MSETQTGDRGSGTDDSNLPARDHDGYHTQSHFFGDACPGGHLGLTEDELAELEQEPIDDGRYDKEVDDPATRAERWREAEASHNNDGAHLSLYLIRKLRREAELEASRQEELWEDDDPEAHL